MNDPTKIQQIILTLADGTRATYSGPYQIPDSVLARVVRVEAMEPRGLPEGRRLGKVDDNRA